MVLGIFLMTAMVPTMIGVNEASKGTRDHEDRRRESARQQRSYLSVQCTSYDGSRQQRLATHNAQVYLGPDRRVGLLAIDWRLSYFARRPSEIASGRY